VTDWVTAHVPDVGDPHVGQVALLVNGQRVAWVSTEHARELSPLLAGAAEASDINHVLAHTCRHCARTVLEVDGMLVDRDGLASCDGGGKPEGWWPTHEPYRDTHPRGDAHV
jgi:hypothetical protein